MSARQFVAGLGAGAAVVAAAVLMFGESTSPTLAGSRHAAPSDDTRTPDLELEVQRLREELSRAERRVVRSSEETPTSRPSGDSVAEEDVARTSDAVLQLLLADYRDHLALGYVQSWSSGAPAEVAEYLMMRWMEAGVPDRALLLMQRLENAPGVTISGYGTWVGRVLLEKGDSALARSAFFLSLRSNPGDWETIRFLMDLDPAGALQIRSQSTGSYESEGQRLTQDAMLMLAAGRRDEALRLVDDLIGRGELSGEAWDMLVKADPAAAESRLRSRTTEDGGEYVANQILLLQSVKSQGRTAEAKAQALALLNGENGSAWTANQVAGMFPDVALQWLKEQAETAPSGEIWGSLGQLHQSAERTSEAVQAYLEAWRLQPSESDFGRRLLELAPMQTLPEVVSRAQANRDDELLGDIADKLWQEGRRSEALSYWQQALAIDEDDSEWINKVRAVNEGRDPL